MGYFQTMRPQIVLFGDENTEYACTIDGGWAAGLIKTYSQKADVIVRGYSDYNTRRALFLLDRIFPLGSSTPPIATTVFFGGDDVAISGRSSDRQHVPVVEYKKNLRTIVSHLKECSPNMLVVLITPLPVNEEARRNYAGVGGLQLGIHGLSALEPELPDRTNAMTGLYAQQCMDLAKELALPCVDLWNKMQQIENWQKKFLCDDGLDLTCKGHHYVHKVVSRALRDHGLHPKLMPYDFPLAAGIDKKDREKSFQQ